MAGALGRYGRHLGVAYLLLHDLSTRRGRSFDLGRSIGADPAVGLFDYATLHALHASQRGSMIDLLTRQRQGECVAAELKALIGQAAGEQAARAEAERSCEKAVAALRDVPDGFTRLCLERIARFIVAPRPDSTTLIQ